jgi:hypothetical protein
MPDPARKYQQLHAINVSVNIGEELQARVKDPLWFLARQWQSGEFEAENGGRLVLMALTTREHPLSTVRVGDSEHQVDLDDPLEAVVEREGDAGDAPAWRSEALEYAFAAEADGLSLAARDYPGRALDWYNFEVAGGQLGAGSEPHSWQVTPTLLYFPGAPNARWWRIEEGDAYFDDPFDPEPNVLSLLLPEFFYTDINNWYTLPLTLRAGTIHEIVSVTAADSFGVVTTIPPVPQAAGEWRLYAMDASPGSGGEPLDGHFLFVPNIAADITYNDDVEEIRLFRDEDANLVWAVEARYTLGDGSVVVNGDLPASEPPAEVSADALPRFRFVTTIPDYWIPYLPRQIADNPALNGEIDLRRGRTRESATPSDPQYKSKVVAESVRLNEEEIPRYGIRVRRIARYARGSDGKQHFWIGRIKETAARPTSPHLRFDFLEND